MRWRDARAWRIPVARLRDPSFHSLLAHEGFVLEHGEVAF